MAAATDDLEPPASRGWFHLATLLVVGIVCWHVTATYTVLSHTVDEPTHIAAGMEWLESGTHRLHSENPPLSRVPLGLGPHLAGLRLPPEGLSFRRGTDVLYSGESYQRNLVLTRVGALPFFLLAILLVWLWTRKLGGGRAAFVAVASFCTVPPVMGHAGLASTDIAFVATFSLALYTCVRWLESPTRRRAVGFGLGVGLALATQVLDAGVLSTVFRRAARGAVAVRQGRRRRGAVAEPEAVVGDGRHRWCAELGRGLGGLPVHGGEARRDP